MKLFILILLVSVNVCKVFTTDNLNPGSSTSHKPTPSDLLANLSPADKIKYNAALDLAKELNRKIFNNRHQSLNPKKLGNKLRIPWFGSNHKPGWDVNAHWDYNCVAVRVDRHGELYIASNVRTFEANLAKGQQKTKNLSPNPQTYGLNADDHRIILETVRKNPYFKDQTVHIVELAKQPKTEIENNSPHAEMKHAKDRLQQQQNDLQNPPKDKWEKDHRKDFDPTNPKKERRKSIIVTSKASCASCSGQLTVYELAHNYENGNQAPKNWFKPNEIGETVRTTYTAEPNPKRQSYVPPIKPKESTNQFGHEHNYQQSSSSDTNFNKFTCSNRAPGARRKRATGSGCSSGCAICLGNNGQVESVNQKEFVEKYKNADDNGKQEMSNIVKKNTDKVDLDGSQNKVQKLVKLEDVKAHVKSVGLVDKIQKVGKVGKGMAKNLGKKGWNYLQSVGESLTKFPSQMKMRISGTRVAQGLSRIAARKGMQKFSAKVNKASSAVGKFLLAKTVINGIAQGDATSLAIVGGRLGGEYLAKGAVWAGTKFFAKGTKIFKAAKFLGKVAGPVGMAVDLGFSVYSLAKSVERLSGATNVYDRNDAIADVVSDALSLAVSVTVIAVAPFFPPAIAIGFVVEILTSVVVALFKAGNEVARIDSEVPLLDFEKEQVFFSHLFDWFGTKRPNYIDNLVGEKKANDLAVQHNLKFLEENPNFAGIVFPSRTLYYEGSCTFTKQSCAFDIFTGCVSWNEKKSAGSGCDMDGECANYADSQCDSKPYLCKCTNDTIAKTFTILDITPIVAITEQVKENQESPDDKLPLYLECICEGPPEGHSEFGVPRKNSVVDLRQKQNVYLDRSVPKDVENAEFLCKPGHEEYAGFTKSRKHSTWSYLCENAIGLLRNNWNSEQTLLFNLEDGDDTVYVGDGDSRSNLFVMGSDGRKQFYGGIGDDTFSFDNCNGSLRGRVAGGRGQDTIALGETCARNQEIQIDFRSGKLASRNGNNLDMRFEEIETVIGRKHEREVVEVACSTKTFVGQGGKYSQMDYVSISSDYCTYNVTISMAAYTEVVSKAERGALVFPFGKEWRDVRMTLDLYPELELQLVFMETSSREVNGGYFQMERNNMDFNLQAGSQRMKFVFYIKSSKKDVSIYFTEQPKGSPSSVLFLTNANKDSEPIFYHSLSTFHGHKERTGSPFWKNLFEIIGSGWSVTGGYKDDDFILHTFQVNMVNGGAGLDTLKFAEKFNDHVTVDLGSNKFQNLEKVIGNPKVPLTVITTCNTQMVVGQGGTPYKADLIQIRDGICSQRNLQITAAGYTRIVMEAGSRNVARGKDIVHVVAHGNSQKVLDFELETKLTDVQHLMVAVVVNHRNWSVVWATVNSAQQTISVKLDGMLEQSRSKDAITLNLRQNTDSNITEQYFQLPTIQLSLENSTDLPGYLVFERKSASPKLIFQPSDDSQYRKEMTANGFLGIENLFVFKTSAVKWTARGGNISDQFVLRVSAQDGGQYSIHGGNGGENVLFLEGEQQVANLPFLINLVSKELGYLATSTERRGNVENIQHVVGRRNAPDIIHPTCDTKTVNGNSGGGNEDRVRDVINIRYSRCPMNLLVTVGKFTDVSNRAVKGDFTYIVPDLVTSSLELKPTKSNTHFIQFRFHPWEHIKAVALDESGSVMAWNVSSDDGERTQIFKMSRPASADEYDNPKFNFVVPESSINSEIRVATNKVTMATFNIQGLDNPEVIHGIKVDVNRYLINITTNTSLGDGQSLGEIHGCPDGGRCSANQFWIFQLAKPMQLLDGGACAKDGCKNYLHLASDIASMSNNSNWIVDMDIYNGSVITDAGQPVIAKLKNTHELHGTQNTVAYVSCNTTKVSGVAQVVITGSCPQLNLVIGIENYTQVIFESEQLVYMEPENDEPKGTVHYKFLNPVSFMPEGDFLAMSAYNHIYYLPFKLDAMDDVLFILETEQLYCLLNETVYNFPMASFAEATDQFYSQPSILTEDGYRLQISRTGSVWVVLGDNEAAAEITSEYLPELRELADRLGVTIMIQGPNDFFFVGHSVHSLPDRNVLHNIANYTSYLAGGGADDTIYEIVSLDADVYIYTGYTEDTFQNWTDSGNVLKQTIDLTDVVVPIRFSTGTKYVPKVSSDEDNNLIITMEGHDVQYPGRIVIVRGAHTWVATRLQLLLNSAIMDLVPVSTSSSRQKRSTDLDVSAETCTWKIQPRPVIIPKDISIFNIAPEELEDGQSIQFDLVNQTNNGTFEVIRNGTDLYLSNVKSAEEDEVMTVIIPDMFEPSPYLGLKGSSPAVEFQDLDSNTNSIAENPDAVEELDGLVLPTKLIGININLPGMSLMLNDSQIFNTTDKSNDTLVPIVVLTLPNWEQVLYQVEDNLLVEIPEIQRTFLSEEERRQVEWRNYTCTNAKVLTI